MNRDHIAQCLHFGLCAALVNPCHGVTFEGQLYTIKGEAYQENIDDST